MPTTETRDTAPAIGSAARWGPLWGARPADWALSEDQQIPTYRAALERVGLEPGQAVLDAGCGVGAFLRLAADRGARVFGIDASHELLDLARRRLPGADLRVGDIEALPYDDNSFDLVTGFNSFFFANDIVAAAGEAGRVAKLGTFCRFRGLFGERWAEAAEAEHAECDQRFGGVKPVCAAGDHA